MSVSVNTFLQNLWADRAKRRKLVSVLLCMSLLVGSSVMWALHITGESKSAGAYCGLEDHTHTDACMGLAPGCGLEECPDDPGHVHTDACYEERPVLVCQLEEHIHSEDTGCYVPIYELNCTEPHHNDGCYETVQQLICEQDHEHSPEAGCCSEERKLICDQQHEHNEGCRSVTGRELICTAPEHSHSAEQGCYAAQTERVLICTEQERAPSQGHTHTEDCMTEQLVCTEHVHSLRCFSDPNAVEDEETWKGLFSNLEFTGDFALDLPAAAKTQLGYTESEDNYQVALDASGAEYRSAGYTRYGHWYGQERMYDDWNAMFVAFCLNYTGITREMIPYEADAAAWVKALTEREFYKPMAEYDPRPGDILFLDLTGDGIAERCGIVTEILTPGESGEEGSFTIVTVEGDYEGLVKECRYENRLGALLGCCDLRVVYEKAVEDGLIEALPLGTRGEPDGPEGTEADEEVEAARGFDLPWEDMSSEERVNYVNELISRIPDEDALMETMTSLDTEGDEDGIAAFYKDIMTRTAEAMRYYEQLSAEEQAMVDQADYLLTLRDMFLISTLEAAGVTEVIVEKIGLSFVGGAVEKTYPDGKTQWVWVANEANVQHCFTYRLDYTTSGEYIEAGQIVIRVPLHILKNRNGVYADKADCPYIERSQLSEDSNTEFAYYTDNNYLYIYNVRQIPAARSGFVEFSYTTTQSTFEYEDRKNSDQVTAAISVDSGRIYASQATAHEVAVDTTAEIRSTKKEIPTYYATWQNEWGTAPANAEDRYYLVWPVYTEIEKTTQPYDFKLTDTFTDMQGQVLKIKFAGLSGAWRDVANGAVTQDKSTVYGGRYDYVLTSIDKTMADNLIDENGVYTVKNTVEATVIPYDRKDSPTSKIATRTYSKEAPVFQAPAGEIAVDKWGIYGPGYTVYKDDQISSYKLGEYLKGTVDTLDLPYATTIAGYPYPWTVADGHTGTEQDLLDGFYGVKEVDWVLTDDEILIRQVIYNEDYVAQNEDKKKLNDADYDFSVLDWSLTQYTATYDESNKVFTKAAVQYDPNDADSRDDLVNFYIRGENSTNWVNVATYSMKTGTYTFVDSDWVQTAKGTRLTFEKGVKGYRIKATNPYFYTVLKGNPTVSLNRTEHIAQLLRKEGTEYDLKDLGDNTALNKLEVYNRVVGELQQNGTRLLKGEREGYDYAQAIIRSSELKKDVLSTYNDKTARTFRVDWKMSFQETYTDNSGPQTVTQKSGIFFDLLPAGAVTVVESVKVQADGVYMKPGEYQIEIVQNYHGTGRQLLKVIINEPAEKNYVCELSATHSWDMINDYGKSLLNSAAFESGNDDIGDGKPDDGGSIAEKQLMAGISGDDDNADPEVKKFQHAQSGYDINANIAASTGLQKLVRADTDSYYKRSTTVTNQGSYSYYIRYENDAISYAKDMMFFDSLENFFQMDKDTLAMTSEWRGTLVSVDVSLLTAKGIDAKVYVHTQDMMQIKNLGISADYDFAAGGWILLDSYTGDLADVHAVAVDARKNTDGSDYILYPAESLALFIYMDPPDGSELSEPITYNNIYAFRNSGQNDTFNDPKLFHQDYVEVKFRVVGDLLLRKVSAINDAEAIKGTTWQLTGTSDYGTYVDRTAVSNVYGDLNFTDIERGTYQLRETACGIDWLLDKQTYTVTVDGTGNVTVTGDSIPDADRNGAWDQTADGRYKLPNEPRIHSNLSFIKQDGVTGAKLKGAKFRLSGTSYYGNNVLQNAESDKTGKVTFKNVERGTYSLVETQTGQDPTKPDTEYVRLRSTVKVKVDENGIVTLWQTVDGQEQELKKDADLNYLLDNEPLHQIRFVKTSSYTDGIISGVEFTLSGTSDYGKAVNDTVDSDEYGMVVFTDLEAGTYLLEETDTESADDGAELVYKPDGKIYTVQLKPDGTYTIRDENGTELDTKKIANADVYNFVNHPDSGTVKVTKLWLDNAPVDYEPADLDLLIATTKPDRSAYGGKLLHFDPNGGSFSNGADPTNDMTYLSNGSVLDGDYLEPTKSNMTFDGWYTQETGGEEVSVDSNTGWPGSGFTGWDENDEATLYAHYAAAAVESARYAVKLAATSITDAAGKNLGLTFIPAFGGNYVSSASYHVDEEDLDNNGFVEGSDGSKRCIHWDDWDTIVSYNETDPDVYDDCVNRCTVSVPLYFENVKNADGTQTFAGVATLPSGDGPSVLFEELFNLNYINYKNGQYENLMWNTAASTSSATYAKWSTSRIRAMLNGATAGVTKGGTSGGAPHSATDYNSTNCLLAAFPAVLRSKIAERTINTAISSSGYETTKDRLWLPRGWTSVSNPSASQSGEAIPISYSFDSTYDGYRYMYQLTTDTSASTATTGKIHWYTRTRPRPYNGVN